MGWIFFNLAGFGENLVTNSETKNLNFHEFRIRIGTSLFVIAIFVTNIHIGKKIHGFRIGCWIQ